MSNSYWVLRFKRWASCQINNREIDFNEEITTKIELRIWYFRVVIEINLKKYAKTTTANT